jgi:hypothetical protein
MPRFQLFHHSQCALEWMANKVFIDGIEPQFLTTASVRLEELIDAR